MTSSATSDVVISSTTSTLVSSSSSAFTDHFANPLYLSPGENLPIPIVGIKLTNNNYHVWSRSMTVALSIKNKLKSVDGSYPAPDFTDATFPAWIRCNFTVPNLILQSVAEDIAQSLILIAKINVRGLSQRCKCRYSS
ncbi:hypothetical protein LINGRAPRIM_LOCUS513 [Linum grandiflorum]